MRSIAVVLTILALFAICYGKKGSKKEKQNGEKIINFSDNSTPKRLQSSGSFNFSRAVYEPGPSSRPLNEDSALYDGAIPGQQAPQMPYYQHQQAPQMPYYQQQHAHPAPPSPLNSYMSSLFHAPSGTPPHRPASPPEPWPYQSAAPAPSNGLSYLFDARTPQHGPASPQASSPYSHNNQSASPQSSTNSNLWRGQ